MKQHHRMHWRKAPPQPVTLAWKWLCSSVELLLQKLLSVNDLPGQISLACCKASVPSAVFHKYSR